MTRSQIVLSLMSLTLSIGTGNATKPDQIRVEVAPVTDFVEICRTKLTDCRGPGSVRLLKEDGSHFELSWSLRQPVVQNDTLVTIYPGETLYLEAEVSEKEIVRLRTVPTVVNPDKTISLTFEQSEDVPDMMLSVSNPFPQHLKYHLGMEVLDREGLFKTSSCPAIAKGNGFEHWPYPIFQLIVTDFRFLSDSDRMDCN